jgi:hypothetical protein
MRGHTDYGYFSFRLVDHLHGNPHTGNAVNSYAPEKATEK